MAGRAKSRKTSRKSGGTTGARRFRPLRWLTRAVGVLLVVFLAVLLLYSRVNPPVTITMIDAWRTHGAPERDWLPITDMAPVLPRSVVAAEDANFCRHWGFDLDAIQAAIDDGARRGASTISQQTAKNVFFWQGRSWFRKALETATTPLVELAWSKQRILEVYLNVAEFDTGVFGVEAASRHYFGVSARDVSAVQAARLAAVLPNPRARSAAQPSDFVRRRAAAIMDGAATIGRDGRSDCFQD